MTMTVDRRVVAKNRELKRAIRLILEKMKMNKIIIMIRQTNITIEVSRMKNK